MYHKDTLIGFNLPHSDIVVSQPYIIVSESKTQKNNNSFKEKLSEIFDYKRKQIQRALKILEEGYDGCK